MFSKTSLAQQSLTRKAIFHKGVFGMAKKKSRKKTPEPLPKILDEGPLAHNPFNNLKDFKVPEPEETPPPKLPDRNKLTAGQESALFGQAMADVVPMKEKNRANSKKPSGKLPELSPDQQDNLEVLAELEDLVTGKTQFDLVDSDEYIEGYVHGMHPAILEKLRSGLFSVQAYLDMHGLTAREAESAVKEFITEAINLNYRCILLVHGRGINSKDQIPVLKERLKKFLLKGQVRKKILAFTSAKPHDGGTGASYVLLRARN